MSETVNKLWSIQTRNEEIGYQELEEVVSEALNRMEKRALIGIDEAYYDGARDGEEAGEYFIAEDYLTEKQ